MTKWEIGQDIIRISDLISEIRSDLREGGHFIQDKALFDIQARIGDIFNENNDHSFGILDSTNSYPYKGRFYESKMQ